jgi:glycosyltransferase involved in cell wall biosynthesis
MMKVLYVIDSLAPGGAERSLVEMLPHLVSRGVEPTVVCLMSSDQGFEPLVRSLGVSVISLDRGSRLATIRALRRVFRREDPDLIHTALFESDVSGRLAAVGLDVPLISTLAGLTYGSDRLDDPRVPAAKLRMARAVDGWTARRLTRRFHAVSETVKRSAVTSLRIDPDRVVVIERGRDPGLLGEPSDDRRREARRRLEVPEDADLVLAIGRQEFAKGHRYLVEAAARLDRRRLRVVVAGRPGHESAALEALIRDHRLEGRASFLGHRSDIPDLLAAADVFVLPSVSEGAGGALIEAMGLGLPIVASDLPAVREAVEHGRSALLVYPRDPAALAVAIQRLLEDGSLRARLGSEARGIFLERYTIEASTDRLMDLYRQVVPERSSRLAEAS